MFRTCVAKKARKLYYSNKKTHLVGWVLVFYIILSTYVNINICLFANA